MGMYRVSQQVLNEKKKSQFYTKLEFRIFLQKNRQIERGSTLLN